MPFIEEKGMKNEDFRLVGHQFVDWIADYFKNVEKFPVLSPLEPGDVKKNVPAVPPARGEAMEGIFRDFERVLLPGISHWQHPVGSPTSRPIIALPRSWGNSSPPASAPSAWSGRPLRRRPSWRKSSSIGCGR